MLTTLITLCACSRQSADPVAERAEARRRLALQRRCGQELAALPRLQDALQRSEQRRLRLEQEVYRPAPAPTPLDPDEQRRLAIYDQEVEQEQYNQALARWQELEVQRQALWQRQRRERLDAARQARVTAVAALRRHQASLKRLGGCGLRPTP